jgi:hypothetical protein
LISDEKFYVCLGLAGVDTLDQHQLSQGNLVDLDFEDVIEVSHVITVIVLFLDTNLSIIIELHCK